jgi:hypothetical protein
MYGLARTSPLNGFARKAEPWSGTDLDADFLALGRKLACVYFVLLQNETDFNPKCRLEAYGLV